MADKTMKEVISLMAATEFKDSADNIVKTKTFDDLIKWRDQLRKDTEYHHERFIHCKDTLNMLINKIENINNYLNLHKGPATRKALQYMDLDYTYEEAVRKTLKEFPDITKKHLEQQLNRFI